MSGDPCYMSAVEMARGVRRGTLSPVDLVEAHLDRIKERNDEVNAFITVIENEAREAAREAEEALDRGRIHGPLHGVPVALKDLNATKAGVRHTYGTRIFEDFVPDETAVFVDRLESAGAIVVGKTNLPEMGARATTDNLLVGPTSCPFDLGRNSGGSSGGSAAAVADGLVPIAQGSDGGGSIRIPSACCGVFGLKPSTGRIPNVSRPDAFSNTTHGYTSQIGPISRTVEDAALMLDVMSGYHPRDPISLPGDGGDYLSATREPIDGFDIAYCPDLDVFPVDDRVSQVVEDAVGVFEKTGADVERVEIGFDHSRAEIHNCHNTGSNVNKAAAAETIKEEKGIDFLEHPDEFPSFYIERIESGYDHSAVDYKSVDIVRSDIFDSIRDVFEDHDVLVAPTIAVPAPENGILGPDEVDGEEVDPVKGWCLTFPFNSTGNPVASIPAGFTESGLPVGMQIVGPRFADDTVLSASAAFERLRPWQDAYPPR